MRRASLALGIAIGAAPALGAQVPPRPARVAAPPFHFPRVEQATLPNGLHVQFVEDHAVAVVAVRAVLNVDETLDPPGKEGLYQVTLGALREGTKSHSAAQIAEESARTGTAVSPTIFTTTPANFDASLALMGDMLMHPAFTDEGIARRRASQASSLRIRATNAAAAPRNLFYAVVDGRDDPVTRSYYASDASVNTITRDDVLRFYGEHFGPQATTIVVAGDITKAKAIDAVTRVFGEWTNASVIPAPRSTARPAARPTTIYLLDSPGTTTYVYVGDSGPVRDASDAFAADVMGVVVADRFVATLRDKRSFMYSGNTGILWRPKPRSSEFVGSTTVSATKADSALAEWLDLLRGLRANAAVTETELENARQSRVGYLWTRSDGPDSVATQLAELARDGVASNFLNTYAAGIGAVTPADVTEAAARYVDTEHLAIVVSGDRRVLEPALRAAKIAPVVVVDRDGKPVP